MSTQVCRGTNWSTFTNVARVNDAFVFHNTLTGGLYPLRMSEQWSMAEKDSIASTSSCGSGTLGIKVEDALTQVPIKDQIWFAQQFCGNPALELKKIEDLYAKQRDRSDILKITVLPTLTCNLKCTYCYAWKATGTMSEQTSDTLNAWLGALEAGPKEVRLYWVGGEPTLAWDTLAQSTSVARSRCEAIDAKFHGTLVSNATALTPERSALLRKLGIETLQVSFDANPGDGNSSGAAERGIDSPAFPKILRNVVEVPTEVDLLIRVNVPRGGAKNAKKLLSELSKHDRLRAATINFSPIHYDGAASQMSFKGTGLGMWESEFALIQLELMQHAISLGMSVVMPFTGRNVCTAMVKHSVVIEPSGRIKKCWVDTGREESEIGDLTATGPVYDSPPDEYFLDLSGKSYEQCRKCSLLPLCFGGCQWRVKQGATYAERCHPLKRAFPEYIDFLCKSVWEKNCVYDGKTGVLTPKAMAA